jgi:hypothetical protein
VQHTGEFSNAILALFFLLLNHKLRVGRTLVRRLKQQDAN